MPTVNLETLKSKDLVEKLDVICTKYLTGSSCQDNTDKVKNVIQSSGIRSTALMEVVGNLLKSAESKPGFFSALTALEDLALGVVAHEVPKPASAASKPESVKQKKQEAESVATKTKEAVIPADGEAPSYREFSKQPGNCWKRRCAGYYILEVMRDGQSRTAQECLDLIKSTFGATIPDKFRLILKQIADPRNHVDGYTFEVKHLDAGKSVVSETKPT